MSGAKKKLERRMNQAQAGMTEREKQELKKQQVQNRNKLLAIVGGALAVVLVVCLLVWNSGFLPRHAKAVRFKAVNAETAAALTGDDLTLTEADMEYFYHLAINNAYSQELSMADFYEQNNLGTYTPSFDPNSNLKKQYIDAERTQSYYDFFRRQALSNATEIISLANAAKAAGYTLSEEAQASLDSAPADLDEQVQRYGFSSRDNYLRAVYGRTMNEKVYMKNLARNILASDYYASVVDKMGDYSDSDLVAYYDSHADELDSFVYDSVYFDGTVQPVTGDDGQSAEPTEEETAAAMADAKAKAQAMLDALKAPSGEESNSFATLAQESGSYANVQQSNDGSALTGSPYAEWLMDSARKDGDVDLFELEGNGYYVVRFHSRSRSDAPSSADVRHILIPTSHEDDPATEDVDESETPFTDEEIVAANAEANTIMQEFLSGDQTGERFGELAEKYSHDGRDAEGNLASPGGLYEDVTPKTNFVPEFLEWIFTDDREAGDVGIVQTTYGFHIMYLDSQEGPQWKESAKNAKLVEEQTEFLESVKAGFEIDLNKWVKE